MSKKKKSHSKTRKKYTNNYKKKFKNRLDEYSNVLNINLDLEMKDNGGFIAKMENGNVFFNSKEIKSIIEEENKNKNNNEYKNNNDNNNKK